MRLRSWSAGAIIAVAVLALETIAGPVAAQGSGWERDGLAGRQIRALVPAYEPAQMIGLVGGAREPTPLWRRDSGGWTQQVTEAPGFVLALAALPDGGVLLGTGRDIADRPGVFWIGGQSPATRHLYDVQAIGVLAVVPGPSGHAAAVYAATAPWADRDAASSIVRWDMHDDVWTATLDGTLGCDGVPSYFRDLLVAPGTPGTVLALEACPGAGRRTTQLWRSDDHGGTWRVLAGGASNEPWIACVAIDPTDDQLLYRADYGRPDASTMGLQRSLDGGHTWTPVGDGDDGPPGVRVLLVDPREPHRLLAGTERDGVYVSSDRGETWQPLPGLADLRVWALAFDPARGRLYAATSDGVWRIPIP